jgi:hypothetical protein
MEEKKLGNNLLDMKTVQTCKKLQGPEVKHPNEGSHVSLWARYFEVPKGGKWSEISPVKFALDCVTLDVPKTQDSAAKCRKAPKKKDEIASRTCLQ